MQNNFPKISFSLSVIFFVFSCVAFLYFWRGTNDNYNKLFISSGLWQEEASRREEIRSLDHSIKIIESERTLLQTHFAQSSDVVPFLDAIEGLAPLVGVKAEVASVDIAPEGPALIVGINASGSFECIYKFLTLLENFPYELEFISINISKKETGDASQKDAKVSEWEAAVQVRLLSFIL